MAVYEKWLGATVGYILGGPLGGFFGYLATDESSEKNYSHTAHTSPFETNILLLAAGLIKADSIILKEEIQFVEKFFTENFDFKYVAEKIEILHHCLQKEYDCRKACDELRLNCSHQTCKYIIQFLFDLSIADKAISQEEKIFIFKIAGWLNINDIDYRKIEQTYSFTDWKEYVLLGVKPTDSLLEIKAVYRKLTLQYHPDRNQHLSSLELNQLAEKWSQIQAAYQNIKEKLGDS